jgi:hypothetical protein
MKRCGFVYLHVFLCVNLLCNKFVPSYSMVSPANMPDGCFSVSNVGV